MGLVLEKGLKTERKKISIETLASQRQQDSHFDRCLKLVLDMKA